MSKSRLFGLFVVMGVLALTAYGCNGSGSSSDGGSVAASVDDLSDVPTVGDMLSVSTTSATVADLAVSKSKTVSGINNVKQVKNITSSNADTYFWNGLVSQINSTGYTANATDAQDFIRGLGSCRMVHGAEYAFHAILDAGVSSCYMRSVPGVSSGVSAVVTSTGEAVTDASSLMVRAASTKVIKVVQTNSEGEGESQTIFMRVYGSSTSEGSASYATDLWFCNPDTGDLIGYENLRVNQSTGVMTDKMYFKSSNTEEMYSDFSGKLTTSGSSVSFDPEEAQTVDVIEMMGSDSFKGHVSVNGDQMLVKSWQDHSYDGEALTDKARMSAQYSGTNADDLKFYQGGVAIYHSQGAETPVSESMGTEWQDDHYEYTGTGDYYDAVNGFDFDSDSFWDGTIAIPSEVTSVVSDYDCSATSDYTITMDMSDSAVQAIADSCENPFNDSDMDFCDSVSVQTAMAAVMSAMP